MMIPMNESEVIISSSHSIVDSLALACLSVIALTMIIAWLPIIYTWLKKVAEHLGIKVF
tara:strand:- start:680 stop:856 length:177 start_codon:yes stop_codon:yes gene_type:complete